MGEETFDMLRAKYPRVSDHSIRAHLSKHIVHHVEDDETKRVVSWEFEGRPHRVRLERSPASSLIELGDVVQYVDGGKAVQWTKMRGGKAVCPPIRIGRGVFEGIKIVSFSEHEQVNHTPQ